MNKTNLIARLRDASRYNSIHGSWAAEAADALEAAQPAPQVPSKSELADMRDKLYKMAEALQPHTQAMYDEAVFTGHMNMLDDSLHQCVTTLAEANKHYYFLRGYLVKWRPSQVPMTDKEIAHAWISIADPIALGGKFQDSEAVRAFVRAVEAHHKIGVKP